MCFPVFMDGFLGYEKSPLEFELSIRAVLLKSGKCILT